LVRSESIYSVSNFARGAALAALILVAYELPNKFVFFPTHSVVMTRFDVWVALAPIWVWFYVAYYPLLIAAHFYTTGTPVQAVYFRAMTLATVVSFFVFVLFPTTIPRELYPWIGEVDFSSQLLALIRGSDNSINCAPSMHVCMSFIAASAFTLACGRWGRFIVWTLFLAICYSTMATKQHYFVDLVGGFSLGLMSVTISFKKAGLLPNLVEDLRQSFQRIL
jgi:membrane-associated phospholipid phosphatase